MELQPTRPKKTVQPQSCGSCTLCCKVLGIRVEDDELWLNPNSTGGEAKDYPGSKPAGVWCDHCTKTSGCREHDNPDRPLACRSFECWWLMSQRTEDPMPLELRPDRTRVVMTSNGLAVTLNVDRDFRGNWRRGPLRRAIDAFEAAGLPVFAAIGDERRAVTSAAVAQFAKWMDAQGLGPASAPGPEGPDSQ
jgi:hypothetical protein